MTLQTIEPQSPFDPESVGPESGSSGRLPRPLLVGCGILLLLIGIGLVAFLVKGEAVMRHLLAWSLDSVESQIMSALPDDLSGPERQRLQHAFDAAEASVRASKSLDVKALQTLQPQLLDVSRSLGKGKLTRQQCLQLAQALEKLAGLETAPESPPQPQGPAPTSPGESEPAEGPTDATLWTMNPAPIRPAAASRLGAVSADRLTSQRAICSAIQSSNS